MSNRAALLGKLSLFILFAVFFGSHPVFAQSGDIIGEVDNASGGGIAHAKVALTNERTKAVLSTTTNNGGLYSYPVVQPEVYTLTVEADGFARYEKTGIVVESSDKLTLNVQLKASAASLSITGQQPGEMALKQTPTVGEPRTMFAAMM